MRFSFPFVSLFAVCFLVSTPLIAEVKTCTYQKQILRSHYSDTDRTCTGVFGESFKVDTTRHLLNVQWPKGVSGWFAPDKVTKNNRFTSYIMYLDLQITPADSGKPAKTRRCTITYRLYQDGKRAEAHQHVQNFEPRAARYNCN